jgi:hypothetical protein
MEVTMTKLRQVLSTFSACLPELLDGELLGELEVSDQEIAEALYRRSERSDTGDPA